MATKKKIAKKHQERAEKAKAEAAKTKQKAKKETTHKEPKARKAAGEKGARVAGILLEKVNEPLVRQYAKDLELAPKSDALPDLVRALQKHQRETTKKERLSGRCSVCGGYSNMDLPACPFCGDATVVQPGEAPPKHSSAQGVLATQEDGSQVIAAGTVAELEAAEQQVRAAKEAGVSSYWDWSYWLNDIYKAQRWQHRTDAEGKQVYKSWGEYAKVEHDLSGKVAMEALEVADNFSREDFLLVGVDRLRSIMRYSGDERNNLLEAVKDKKMTRAQLREYIAEHPPAWKHHAPEKADDREVVDKTTGEKRKGGFRGGASASQKGTEKLREKAKQRREAALASIKDEAQMVVFALLGRHKIGLFAKADTKKRATTFAQEPVGKLVLPSGHVLHFQLVKDSNGLAIVMNVKKEDKGKAAA